MSANSDPLCRLYLITPPAFELEPFARDLALALDAGDVGCVQLRIKPHDDDAIRRAVDRLRPLVQERDIAFILNDRPDLAASTGCDGVHIGQTDGTYAAARQLVGPDKIVGLTCHANPHSAIDAAEEGADYVAFGAFFPSLTKPPAALAELDVIEWWATTMTVPCVAIGGITAENCKPLVTAGADFLAVVSAVWDHAQGPAAGIKALNRAIAEGLAARG